jgi:hypothetical protein
MARHCLVAALCLALGAGAAHAVEAEEAVPSVTVHGTKNPEMRSYRNVVAGLDAFSEYHALAPAVPELHFRMVTKSGRAIDATEALAIRIVSDDESASIPVAADGLFSVPRLAWAYEHDAILVLNRAKGEFSTRPDVRTPGLPDNVRRLGDLRLECQVTMAVIKKEIPFLARAAINTMLMTGDWCTGKKDMDFGVRSPAPLAGGTLSFGERRQKLKFTKWNYHVPLGDRDWPDDALVELQYKTPPVSGEAKPPAASL